ncbi:hypothetical protein QBC39DRAFT_329318 [Podospora conica]|nr:hypothetical protein QBC39DRAFT_329318 [Schizothecium conicum]
MGKQVGFADFHLYRVPQNCPMSTSNYLQGHPPTDQQLGRDSLGSDCSVPGMVDDHGSDVSLEDDYQLPGAELWDSFWQSHLNNRTSTRPTYPALLDSPAKSQGGHGQGFRMGYENQHRQPGQTYPGEYRKSPSRPAPAPAPAPPAKRQRSSPPRPPPRASYSIFPPPTCQERRPPPTSRSSLNLPRGNPSGRTTPASRPTSPIRPSRPPSSAATATIRPVPPTPLGSPPTPFPAFPSDRPSSLFKPLPPSPPHTRPPSSRRPSLVNLRNLSLSKLSTTSSPSLAQLAHQQQARSHQHPLRESARPLPPLPQPQPEPEPPHVSVFEFDDSDTEESGGGSFARRIMRGLKKGGHHHHEKCHQRSASDGRSTPVTAPTPTGRARADTVGAASAAVEGGEGRPWLTRQSSEVFERITKGFGGRWSG